MNIIKLITEQNIIDVARSLNLEPACIKAVLAVESKGKGFLSNGNPIILFEGHIFWNKLKSRKIDPKMFVKGNEDILYPAWTKKFYKGGIKEYSRLQRAKLINEDAALSSASWGLFQIMGFNCRLCGFVDVKNFVNAMYKSEYEQLKAFANFIRVNGLFQKLQDKDWVSFAKVYNGSKQDQGTKELSDDYSYKLQVAYNEASGEI